MDNEFKKVVLKFWFNKMILEEPNVIWEEHRDYIINDLTKNLYDELERVRARHCSK